MIYELMRNSKDSEAKVFRKEILQNRKMNNMKGTIIS
jgi:hypothetical protein